jgi:hypothetical protein
MRYLSDITTYKSVTLFKMNNEPRINYEVIMVIQVCGVSIHLANDVVQAIFIKIMYDSALNVILGLLNIYAAARAAPLDFFTSSDFNRPDFCILALLILMPLRLFLQLQESTIDQKLNVVIACQVSWHIWRKVL